MLKCFSLFPLFLLFILTFHPLSSFSQKQKNRLLIDGVVRDDTDKLPGAGVTLYKNNEKNEKIITTKNGKFFFYLEMEAEYVFEFSKAGYFTKKISVDTRNVLPEEADFGFEDHGSIIHLIKEVEGVDASVFDKPIGRMFYVENKGFEYDSDYSKEVQTRIEKLKKDIEKKQKDLAADEKKYKSLITSADKKLASGDYENALKEYEAAPESNYTKQKIMEVNALIAKKNNKEQQLAEYNKQIAEADRLFKLKDYPAAKKLYQQAVAVNGEDPYPVRRITEIIRLISKQEADSATKRKDKTTTVSKPAIPTLSEEQKPLRQSIPSPQLLELSDPIQLEKFIQELAKKYPEGVTEEKYMEGNKHIVRRIVVKGNKGTEYKMVEHPWGGKFFFRNGISVTELIWDTETKL